MNYILFPNDRIEAFSQSGGKARNLARLSQHGFTVPEWFSLTAKAFTRFLEHNRVGEKELAASNNLAETAARIESLFLGLEIPKEILDEVAHTLTHSGLSDGFVAVRSSGLDEDSADHSFAGQFSSFLYQRGMADIVTSIKRCWASGYSERALSYRRQKGLSTNDICVGVVIQKMVNARSAGVAFSRNPLDPTDRESVVVSSVWGLGEGLVSGELDADHFEIGRDGTTKKTKIVEKTKELKQAPTGGLQSLTVSPERVSESSLDENEQKEIATLVVELEMKLGAPQDCEWAYEDKRLYLVQTRPITTLPGSSFYNDAVRGKTPILWDNSNIIESYSGVTSPLTFSFARSAYEQVYIQFCEVMGVPKAVIKAHEAMYRNMLGLLRGRVFYNLINWYRLVLMLPGSANNKGFMETMMGVQQGLKPEVTALFDFVKHPPRYSFLRNLSVTLMTLYRFLRMDTIIGTFRSKFESVYQHARKLNMEGMSLSEQAALHERLNDEILRRWQAPIINDYLCMIFFGLLKKLTQGWVAEGDAGASLQNDLLCGQGDLESTEPTKTLMRLADRIDHGDTTFREWFTTTPTDAAWKALPVQSKEVTAAFHDFLDRFGFRCVNELKLEENDLNDDPSFVVSAVQSYVRMKSYSIASMEKREKEIKEKAEALVRSKLSPIRRYFYFWILKQARRAVKNRENLRFARTKIFGVARHLFRGMGLNLAKLGVLDDKQDIFYLTVDEIISYIEGRAMTLNLRALVNIRKIEFDQFKKTPAPPARLITYGSTGTSLAYPQLLIASDLLKDEARVSDDPNVLLGTPCCPGVVEGTVRVAETLADCQGLSGEILVTERTDPGWVPLYPSCSGLLIERGSLLSHSAVVARELGLPTVVGISGGLLKKLKTGMRVRMDAAKGEVKIL